MQNYKFLQKCRFFSLADLWNRIFVMWIKDDLVFNHIIKILEIKQQQIIVTKVTKAPLIFLTD